MSLAIRNTVDINNLIVDHKFPCLTIFIQNDQPWPGNEGVCLKLRAELKKCREQLKALRVSEEAQAACLDELEKWVKDNEWLRDISSSVGFFTAADGFARAYQLPVELETSSHIGHFFDVRPLIPLAKAPSFKVATVSLNGIHLFQVTPSAYKKIPLEESGKPVTFSVYRKFDDPGPAMRTGMGEDSQKDFRKGRVEDFGRHVAKLLTEKLVADHGPIIIMGLLPLLGIVKTNLNLPGHLADDLHFIEQDPDARPFAKQIEEFREFITVENFRRIEGTIEDRVATYGSMDKMERRLDKIMRQAHRGRIRELFIGKQDYVWGAFKPETEQVKLYKGHIAKSEDLLNMASVYTLRNGGDVYIVDPKKISIAEHAFAVLR